MKRTDYAKDEVLVHPDTEPVWRLWDQVRNQWRAGAGGAYALDYNTLFYLLDRMRLPEDEQDDLFDSIRVIESEVLAIWQEEREEREAEEKRRAKA